MAEISAPSGCPSPMGAGSLRLLPPESLRTSYAPLRPGCPDRVPQDLAPLPIRVVPLPDGSYEVLDGFKRLEAWRQSGSKLIPALLERPSTPHEHKRMLLAANSPPRTLTALDEGRVVCSLQDEQGMSPTAISRLLERKPQWVARRVDIATRLSSLAQSALARGRIGPTLAHALCAFSSRKQKLLLGALETHALKHAEALSLLSAYRVASAPERRTLLDNPLGLLRAEPHPSPTGSALAADCERRLGAIREALDSFEAFVIPPELAPPEARRLEAQRRGVVAQLCGCTSSTEPARSLAGSSSHARSSGGS